VDNVATVQRETHVYLSGNLNSSLQVMVLAAKGLCQAHLNYITSSNGADLSIFYTSLIQLYALIL